MVYEHVNITYFGIYKKYKNNFEIVIKSKRSSKGNCCVIRQEVKSEKRGWKKIVIRYFKRQNYFQLFRLKKVNTASRFSGFLRIEN